MYKQSIKRREFLQKAAIFSAGLLTVSGTSLAMSHNNKSLDTPIPLLNPAFKVNTFVNGELELYTYQVDRSKLSEIFSRFDADIILEILNHNNPFEKSDALATKYNLSGIQSKDWIQSLLSDFEKSGVIYYGETMLVKIQEAKRL